MHQLENVKDTHHRPGFIGRVDDLEWARGWLLHPHAPTRIWAVHSIGGGGKTTLAREILRVSETHNARVLMLDCQVIDTSARCLEEMQRWMNRSSRDKARLDAVVADFHEHSLGKKMVLCFDGIDHSETLESFLRDSLLPALPPEQILVVLTSSAPLSVRWRSHPVLLHMLKHTELKSFTPGETLDYCKRSGIDDETVALSLFSSTAGHPLALALAVESHLHAPHETSTTVISSEISGALLRQVTSPELHPLLDVLTVTRHADQDLMSRILKRPVSYDEFQALSKLSLIHYSNQGLTINGTARIHLKEDLRIRNRLYYYTLHRAAVAALKQKIRETRGALRLALAAQLVSMCIDVSDVLVFPWPDKDLHPSRDYPACTPVRSGDAASMHRLLERNPTGCVECWDMPELHQFVDTLVERFPHGIRVVRNTGGEIAAFYVILPFFKETAQLLPTNIRYLLEVSLAHTDIQRLVASDSDEVDTYLMVLGCVDSQNPEYTMADLQIGMALDQWSVVEYGSRQLHIGRLEQSTFFYGRLGFTYLKPHEPRDVSKRIALSGMKLHSLDLRSESSDEFGHWVSHLLSQIYPFPVSDQPDILVDTKALRQLLTQLDDNRTLSKSALAQELGMTGSELQQRIRDVITRPDPQKPLTKLHQEVLVATYLQSQRHYMDVMEQLHMTRTTYYRQLKDAIQALSKVLS